MDLYRCGCLSLGLPGKTLTIAVITGFLNPQTQGVQVAFPADGYLFPRPSVLQESTMTREHTPKTHVNTPADAQQWLVYVDDLTAHDAGRSRPPSLYLCCSNVAMVGSLRL